MSEQRNLRMAGKSGLIVGAAIQVNDAAFAEGHELPRPQKKELLQQTLMR